MRKPDITYFRDGMFTRFLPETQAGEDAWRVMVEEDADGVSAVLTVHERAVMRQLRDAGLVVRKATPAAPMTADELDAMLAELRA